MHVSDAIIARMSLEQLKTALAVAQLGSFAKVAREAGVDPSSVSRAISGLEESLGARLFQRSTRRLEPTPVGEAFLERLSTLMDGLDEAIDGVRARENGIQARLVRITSSVAFGEACLVPVLPTLRDAVPGLQVELVLTDANLDLVHERIDIAIRLGPSYPGNVVGVKLMPTRYHVVTSPSYLGTAPPLDQPRDLENHPCLRFSLPEFRSGWTFLRGDTTEEIGISGDIMISSANALRRAALAGLGPALLADWLIGEDLRAGTLVDLFPDYQVTATNFETAAWLLYPSRRYVSAATRAVIDVLRAQFKHR